MKAISDKLPSKMEIENSTIISKFLRRKIQFLREEERIFREMAIDLITKLVKEWVGSYLTEIDIKDKKRGGVTIEVSGSYRLGDTDPGADVDLVVIVPKFITPTNFFDDLRELLLQQKEISELKAIPTAFVPILKFNLNSVAIDLLYGRINLDYIPENFDVTTCEIDQLDENSLTAINGPICAEELLMLVPNKDLFLSSVKFIKYWAKKRGVYGNSYGFLGGISWCILIARVCQLYPKAALYTICHRFFWIFSGWSWPNPVIIKPVEKKTKYDNNVWVQNPEREIMPIITPSYPSQNSTFNVGYSQLETLQKEFLRGKEEFDKMQELKTPEEKVKVLEVLTEESDFFISYNLFIVVQVEATNQLDFNYFTSFVESKVRFLCEFLREVNRNLQVRLYPEPFKNPNKRQQLFFLGINYMNREKGKKKSVDVGVGIDKFRSLITKYKYKSEFTKTMNLPRIQVLRRKDIPQFVITSDKKKNMFKRKREKENKDLHPEVKKTKVTE